jgi:hypothetical protein
MTMSIQEQYRRSADNLLRAECLSKPIRNLIRARIAQWPRHDRLLLCMEPKAMLFDGRPAHSTRTWAKDALDTMIGLARDGMAMVRVTRGVRCAPECRSGRVHE